MKHSEMSGTITTGSSIKHDIVYFKYTAVHMNGIINVSDNIVTQSVIVFQSCDIAFAKTIVFSFNKCRQVIALISPVAYIMLIEFAHVTFTNNTYKNTLIAMEVHFYKKPCPFCLFQYMANNSNVSMVTNSVTITDSLWVFLYIISVFFSLQMATNSCTL